MGLLDDFLGKLVDMSFKVDSGEIWAVNVKTENKTFNFKFQFQTPEAAKSFGEGMISPGAQEEIKEDVRRRLESITPSLQMFSDSTAVEVVAVAAGLSALEAIKIKNGGALTITGDVNSMKISNK